MGEAPISICSFSPKHIQLHVKSVGNVTNALAKLKRGDHLLIRGPYGKGYPMSKLKWNHLLIIGGGSGVAPLKGVVEYIEKHRTDFREVKLYFGFRSPEDILFKDEIERWRENFHVNLSVDKNPNKCHLAGCVGYITELLEKSYITPEKRIALVCGPPMMMKICIDILKEKGFSEDQIYVSYERLMQCGLGVCGHCMIHGKYVCKDGPVFRYDQINHY